MSVEGLSTTRIRQLDTHRLVPARHSTGSESVLSRIAAGDAHLADLFDLDHATNARLHAENSLLPGIGAHELVFGVPYFRIVNATFTHAHPLGSRFNGPDRGAWYAGFELATALAEVIFHKAVEYAEIQRFDDAVTYDDYMADFSGELHDLRGSSRASDWLAPDSYVESQALAERLLAAGSQGILYPSVRRAGGTCLCCMRPTLVANVRRSSSYRLSWSGSPRPEVTPL